MSKKSRQIPVNKLPEGAYHGIMMMRDSFDGSPNSYEVERSHRDGGYTFIIQEEGNTHIEIDFQTYCIQAPAIVFIKPDQVHRLIKFEHAAISTWIITEEDLRSEYLNSLQNLSPVKPLAVEPGTLATLSQAAALCLKLSEQKEEKLYHSILKESCNTLVAMVVSQYLGKSQPSEHFTRFEIITRSFKTSLEKNFRKIKEPAAYAELLNISTSYLNECVKATTGRSVSAHIQQRVMLEAKRLLFHSSRSVKEIAGELGYHDHSYFIRLFVKVAGSTPIAFRDKNRE
ncbi:helix-turn-helix domain-containing protein [Mucilaginibacter pedocola]|uniref:AraC family transcriptional regulator n=1 Tax=Mucilaginibacter pedocola TaxID=1792845 RepID=A0A1S9PLT1_9SPHI|nr:helix-turn-helix domain-containing protein [Mucilaginibacter pedocola]OOQ61913.1 AraC family transcriptional regulator [Mucilaginibacter pedocola]